MIHAPTESDLPQDASSWATDGAAALRVNHDRVQARIAGAARAAGRDPADVSLLAVSKTFDASAVLVLAACGQRAFAESYLQEALEKMSVCRDRWTNRESGRSDTSGGGSGDTAGGGLGVMAGGGSGGTADGRPGGTAGGGLGVMAGGGLGGASAGGSAADALVWHFIGPVQSNKTRPIAESFDWVHSIEREKIAQRLSDQRPTSMPPLQVCLQVNVSGESSKSGCAPGETVELAMSVAQLPGLRLRGLMTIPEPSTDPRLQRARFATLASLLAQIRSAGVPVDTLSMGMSDDLELAIAEGATIVRVGTALFGRRPDGQRTR